jgi:HAMP domain-containing protein
VQRLRLIGVVAGLLWAAVVVLLTILTAQQIGESTPSPEVQRLFGWWLSAALNAAVAATVVFAAVWLARRFDKVIRFAENVSAIDETLSPPGNELEARRRAYARREPSPPAASGDRPDRGVEP